MSMLVHRIFLVCAVLLAQVLYAASAMPGADCTSCPIESLIAKTLPQASIGIVVLEADSGKLLYEKNAREPFPPASTAKLFTAAAALIALGADYQFQTSLQLRPQEIQEGTLRGNLYLQFSGDPSLRATDLQKLLAALKASGIRAITGDLILDDTRFQGPNYALAWNWEELAWYYAAPITTVILNENAVAIKIQSNKVLGQKAEISLASTEKTENLGAKLQSEVLSVTPLESETLCQIQVHRSDQNHIKLAGCWPQQAEPVTLKIAVKDPNVVAKQMLKDFLKSEKISFSGKILSGIKTPSGLKILAAHHSEPLKILLEKVLRDSNNLYTDAILKTLGAERLQQGSFQGGILVLKEILSASTDVDFSRLRLMDGSGLSNYNLVAPYEFSRLLFAMEHNKAVGLDFKNALAVSGRDDVGSTLRYRFKSFDLADRIQAKTGTTMGHSGLAGYLTATSGKKIIFVVIVDHTLSEMSTIKAFEDELCSVFSSLY